MQRLEQSRFLSYFHLSVFQICSAKVSELRIFLSAALGSFRFDLRLVEDGRVLEIATNTAST